MVAMIVGVQEQLVELRWHGRGGQGVVTASNLLVEAALRDGKHFQSLPEFGAERSGAPLVAYTRISTGPIILRTQVTEPDIVVVLDPTLISRVNFTSGLKPSGMLLLNTPLEPETLRPKLQVPVARLFTVDATRIALETLRRNIPNAPLLGALLRITGIVSREAAIKAMGERLGGRLGERVLQANLEAFERGFQGVQGPGLPKEAPKGAL